MLSFLSSACVTHCLHLFRKQCQWAWSCSRAAGGSSSSWRGWRRTTIWPQESPGWKIQPHSWLNCSYLSPYIHSSLTPFSSENPLPFVCTTEILFGVRQTAVSSTSPSALFWYLFLENCFVLFLLFVCFYGCTLCISSSIIQSPFMW